MLYSWSRDIQGTFVDIGCGQGICSEKISIDQESKYIGVEPSVHLINRAEEKYVADNRQFLVGNAYKLPINDGSADACFSVNVWFHLEDINLAAKEMARILKDGGHFLITTANPDAYKRWEDFYYDKAEDGKKIVGKIHIPINPLSRNTFYRHSINDIRTAVEGSGLTITNEKIFGQMQEGTDLIFICLTGVK